MASNRKVGRNERCPCGSGKKYKTCCALKKKSLSKLAWLAIGAGAIVAVLALVSVFRSAGDSRSISTCPPGQSWSSAHGHCH